MAFLSLRDCAVPARIIPPSQLVSGSQSHHLKPLVPTLRVPPFPFTFRFKNTVRLQIKQRPVTVFASNSNPSGGDPLQEKSDRANASDAGQGPPFLTILAGFVVFFLVCWIVGSVALWVISLIVKLPPSK